MKKMMSLLLAVVMLSALCGSVYAADTADFVLLQSAAYSPKLDMYAAGGRYGGIYVSKNGTDFMRKVTGSNVIGNNGRKHLVWLDGTEEFLALDQNNSKTKISVSSDGKTWTSYDDVTSGGASIALSAVSYIGGSYVGAGSGGHLYTSANLTEWTKMTAEPYLTGSNAFFRGITLSSDGAYAMFYATKSWDATGNTGAFLFAADTTQADWYTNLQPVNTTYDDGIGKFTNVYDVKYSGRTNRFYGVAGAGSSDAFFFEYEADIDTLYRRNGATSSLPASTLAVAETENSYVFAGIGKLYSVAKTQMEGDYSTLVFTVTDLTASAGSQALGTSQRIFALAEGKSGVVGTLAQAAPYGILHIDPAENTYSIISQYYTTDIFAGEAEYSILTERDTYERSLYGNVTIPVTLFNDTEGTVVDNATYTLETPVEGVSITTGNTSGLWGELTVAPGAAPVSVTVQATAGNATAQKTISFTAGTKTAVADLPQINAVAYSPALALYIAAGAEGAIYSSPDALHWTKRRDGGNAVGTNGQKGLFWVDDKFVALYTGTASCIMVSADGISWNEYTVDMVIDTAAKFGSSFIISETGGRLYETEDFMSFVPLVPQNDQMSSANGSYRGILPISDQSFLLYNTYDWNGTYTASQKAELVLATKTADGYMWEMVNQGVFRRFYEFKKMPDGKIFGVASTGSSSSVIVEYDAENKTVISPASTSLGITASTLADNGTSFVIGDMNGGIYQADLSGISTEMTKNDLTKIAPETAADRLVESGSLDRIQSAAYGHAGYVFAVRGKACGKIAVYNPSLGTYKLVTKGTPYYPPEFKLTNGAYEIDSLAEANGEISVVYKVCDDTEIPAGAVIYIAVYGNGGLIEVEMADISQKKTTAKISIPAGEGITVKAFVWDSELRPLVRSINK